MKTLLELVSKIIIKKNINYINYVSLHDML
jgi:hypothetical protein